MELYIQPRQSRQPLWLPLKRQRKGRFFQLEDCRRQKRESGSSRFEKGEGSWRLVPFFISYYTLV